MRAVLLRVGLLLMGIGLVGGATGTVLVTSFKSIDEQVGTNGSAAAAVLGIGLIVAAINPTASVAWVRAGILYGLVVLVFEIISRAKGGTFHLGPVIFGLAFTLLLVATYPERKKLLPEVGGTQARKEEEDARAVPTARVEEKGVEEKGVEEKA